METTTITLEYFKLILSGPVLVAIITGIFIVMFRKEIKALLLRIAKIKFPGGTEVSTPQSDRTTKDESKVPIALDNSSIEGIPAELPPDQKEQIEQLIRSHIANTYLWEYRYLNYYLVKKTQIVLNWLIGLPQPTTYAHYDSFWLPLITSANERQAIITALQSHHLIMHDEKSNMITVTPKGEEYQEWRGEIPPRT